MRDRSVRFRKGVGKCETGRVRSICRIQQGQRRKKSEIRHHVVADDKVEDHSAYLVISHSIIQWGGGQDGDTSDPSSFRHLCLL